MCYWGPFTVTVQNYISVLDVFILSNLLNKYQHLKVSVLKITYMTFSFFDFFFQFLKKYNWFDNTVLTLHFYQQRTKKTSFLLDPCVQPFPDKLFISQVFVILRVCQTFWFCGTFYWQIFILPIWFFTDNINQLHVNWNMFSNLIGLFSSTSVDFSCQKSWENLFAILGR